MLSSTESVQTIDAASTHQFWEDRIADIEADICWLVKYARRRHHKVADLGPVTTTIFDEVTTMTDDIEQLGIPTCWERSSQVWRATS